MAVVVSNASDAAKQSDRFPWAFLFALEREATPFRRCCPDALICVSGVGSRNAVKSARKLIQQYPSVVIICCGFAGALRSELAIGDVIQMAEIIDESGQRWPCDARPGTGRLLTMSRIVGDPVEKRRLGEQFAAKAVDMESAAVAATCADANVPFGCVRVISDTVDQRLSERLTQLISNGGVTWWRALASLFGSPGLLPEFIRLARQTSIASRKLAAALDNFRWH